MGLLSIIVFSSLMILEQSWHTFNEQQNTCCPRSLSPLQTSNTTHLVINGLFPWYICPREAFFSFKAVIALLATLQPT
jgi:hypothetical protein